MKRIRLIHNEKPKLPSVEKMREIDAILTIANGDEQDPNEWVCSHYQRKDFPVFGEDEIEHLAHCYVDSPGYW